MKQVIFKGGYSHGITAEVSDETCFIDMVAEDLKASITPHILDMHEPIKKTFRTERYRVDDFKNRSGIFTAELAEHRREEYETWNL